MYLREEARHLAGRVLDIAQGRTGAVDEAALQGRVHVLIVGARNEGTGGDVRVEAGQRVVHVRAFLVASLAARRRPWQR